MNTKIEQGIQYGAQSQPVHSERLVANGKENTMSGAKRKRVHSADTTAHFEYKKTKYADSNNDNVTCISQRNISPADTGGAASVNACINMQISSSVQQLIALKENPVNTEYPHRIDDNLCLRPVKLVFSNDTESAASEKTAQKLPAAMKSTTADSPQLTELGWLDEIAEEQKKQDKQEAPLFVLGVDYIKSTMITDEEYTAALEKIHSCPELLLSKKEHGWVRTCNKTRIGEGVYSEVYDIDIPPTTRYPDLYKFRQKVSKECDMNDKNPLQLKKHLVNEAGYLCRLNHPNVIKLTGFCTTSQYTYLILEKKQDSIHGYLSQPAVPFTVCKKMLCDMVRGMNYLHSNHIMHCDAHAGNFLIDNNGTVLIADLGAAADLSATKRFRESPPVFWAAPELTYKEYAVHNIATDVFALGFSMQSVLAWKSRYIAWFNPALKEHPMLQHKKKEIETFCNHIDIWKENNHNVNKIKWLIHEVIPDEMLLHKDYCGDQQEVSNTLRCIKIAMAYKQEARPDTTAMLELLSQ